MWQRIDFCVARRARESRRHSGSCRSGFIANSRSHANLELRQADIRAGPLERGAFDLVTARAVLHHIADPETAIANMIASLREGGALLLIEPDFLPISIAEPQEVRAFWNGWLAWSRERGIDYHIGRKLADRLASLGLTQISGIAETAIYNVRS